MDRLKEKRKNIIGGVMFALPVITLVIFLMGDDDKITEDNACSSQNEVAYHDNNYTWGSEPTTTHNYFLGVECLDKGGNPCAGLNYYDDTPSDLIVTWPNINKSRSTSCTDSTKVSEPNAVTLVALGALLISLMRRIK
jgi:hypothetical protein